MSTDEGAYVAGAFWSLSPVIAVTSAWEGKRNGQIAVSVVNSSILHSHPRLLLGIWKRNYTHGFIMKSKKLVVHLLRKDQLATVRHFGFYTGREVEKFKDIEYREGVTGCPVLEDCHSYAECEVINAMDGGDMTAFLVKVVKGGVVTGGEWMTLSWFYTQAPPEWIAEYESRLVESVEYSRRIIDQIDYTPWEP